MVSPLHQLLILYMMFEAFGFMHESPCTAENQSQLPSVGQRPTAFSDFFYLIFWLPFPVHQRADCTSSSLNSAHASLHLSTILRLTEQSTIVEPVTASFELPAGLIIYGLISRRRIYKENKGPFGVLTDIYLLYMSPHVSRSRCMPYRTPSQLPASRVYTPRQRERDKYLRLMQITKFGLTSFLVCTSRSDSAHVSTNQRLSCGSQ